jgi:hypothetical protein
VTPLRFDRQENAEAAVIQRQFPDWVVMWRPWGRTYSAWHMGDAAECRVVEAPTTDELRHLMIAAHRESWRASTPMPSWPSQPHRPAEARQARPRGPETIQPPSRACREVRGGEVSRGRGLHRTTRPYPSRKDDE